MGRYVFETSKTFGRLQEKCNKRLITFTAGTLDEFTKKLSELVEDTTYITRENIGLILKGDFEEFLNGNRNYIIIAEENPEYYFPVVIRISCFTADNKITLYRNKIKELEDKIIEVRGW